MLLLILLALVVLIFFGVGFVVHLLWIVAAVALVVWLISLLTGVGRKSRA